MADEARYLDVNGWALVTWCSGICGRSRVGQACVLILPNAQKPATGLSDPAAGM